jgi:hypothetical protein
MRMSTLPKTPLQKHFESEIRRDSQDRESFPARLNLEYLIEDGGWSAVNKAISGLNRLNAHWFPDSNVAFNPNLDSTWDAFRVAALDRGCTKLTAAVMGELEKWLDDPFPRLEKRANEIKSGLQARSWIDHLMVGDEHSDFVLYYTKLLGLRRLLAVANDNRTTPLAIDGSNKSLSLSKVAFHCGERSTDLARKGRADKEKRGAASLNDELHCVTVILNAIRTRNDSYILTTDRDFLEIFYKGQWFLDTHYRSWLTSRMIVENNLKPTRIFNESNQFFTGELMLFARSSKQAAEVLPRTFSLVRAGVIYVSPKEKVHIMTFNFETEMLSMRKRTRT